MIERYIVTSVFSPVGGTSVEVVSPKENAKLVHVVQAVPTYEFDHRLDFIWKLEENQGGQ